MELLIGNTGFVGGTIARERHFDLQAHRSNIESVRGLRVELLVCAGLPAEKWRANDNAHEDWTNMVSLAQVLASVHAEHAVLISTVDVYQPPLRVSELDSPVFAGAMPYGMNRAWFEVFFRSQFPRSTIVRLPGLFAKDVRKNLIHDLLHKKEKEWIKVNPESQFQFFDATHTWRVVQQAMSLGVNLLNVSSEPVCAQEVASLFGVRLTSRGSPVNYDMRSIHADRFGGRNGYLFDKDAVLAGIDEVRRRSV